MTGARKLKVLVADDDKLIRWPLCRALETIGHTVVEATDGWEALKKVGTEAPDAVLLDIRMPGLGGIEVLQRIRETHGECAVVMMTAHASLDSAIEAMRLGATDYLRKPFEVEEVTLLVARIAERVRLVNEVGLHIDREERKSKLDHIVGDSESAQKLRDLIGRVAASDATTILVDGETGTGKGLVARILHYAGKRGKKPFVEVSCTALANNLVESELFGHERGAFTDAKKTKKGMLELADGGTVFLDEIGDMPLEAQAKLLTALEDRSFRRVGGLQDINVNVRVVAATNHVLAEDVDMGHFRIDLFYRLNVLRIRVEPLRRHPEDIPPMCDHFIEHFNREFGRHYETVAPEALDVMRGYHWPGNVRELRNVIERAMILGDRSVLGVDDLPMEITHPSSADTTSSLAIAGVATPSLEMIERGAIERALRTAGGNQSQAARLLGMSRNTLRYRLKKHGL